ncbi:MAG: hypothetical protein ACHQPH_18645 [Reyranellales bacterium]
MFGFGLVTLDAKKADVSFHTLADVRDPKSTIATHRRFVVAAGRPGVVPA